MRLFKILRFIPNIPFILVYGICILIMIYKNTNYIELEIIAEQGFEGNEDLKNFILKTYPKHLQNFIALLFYSSILIKILTN